MPGTLITPRVQRWLRNSRSARVLHLFDGACNWVNDQNEVISLVAPRVGPGPFTIVLAGDFTAGLDVGQPISIDVERQKLNAGPLVIEVGRATVWQPMPDWRRLQDSDITQWPRPIQLPPSLDISLEQTINGIVADDLSMCLAGVEGLAGRGGGLTPTGDDILIGVLFGLWVWYPSQSRRPREEWMGMIAETAMPRTATLSANFLRAAADGEAVWQWHDLVNGRSGAIDQILAIGHTSGADAWAGFARVRSMLNLRPADHP